MAHSLVLEHGSLPSLPTDYLRWDGWATKLAASEEADDAPQSLPTITLPINLTGSSDRRDLDADQTSLLKDALAALFFVQETGRKIVIRADAKGCEQWIAELLSLLPLHQALKLSVSTYQFDSVDCADINATVEGTRFTFNQTQRDLEFFVFEPSSGLRSQLPSTNPELTATARSFAETVVELHLHNPGMLGEYKLFADSFDQTDVDRWLPVGLSLFLQVGSDRSVSDSEFSLSAEFVSRFTLPDRWTRSVEMLHHLLKNFDGRPTRASIKQVIEIVLSAKDSSDQSTLAGTGLEAWQELFIDMVCSGNMVQSELDGYWRRLIGSFPNEIEPKLLLEPQFTNELHQYYPLMVADCFGVIGGYFIAGLGESAEIEASPQFHTLLEAAADRKDAAIALAAIFSVIHNFDGLAGAFAYLANAPKKTPALGQVLLHVNTTRTGSSWKLRERLNAWDAKNLLLDEFVAITRGDGGQERFVAYAKAAAEYAPNYWRTCRTELLETYWQGLALLNRKKQAIEWTLDRTPEFASPALRLDILRTANEAVSLEHSDKTTARLAARVSAEAIAGKVDLVPNRPEIRDGLLRIGKARTVNDIVRAFEIVHRNAANLSEGDYRGCARLLFAQLFAMDADSRELGAVIGMGGRDQHPNTLVDCIGGELAKILKTRKIRSKIPSILIGCVDPATRLPEPLSHNLLERLATELASVRDASSILANAERQVFAKSATGRDAGLAKLKKLRTLVVSKQNASGGSLRHALGRAIDGLFGRRKD